MFVKPAEHPTEKGVSLKVRHPRTHVFMAAAGEDIPHTLDGEGQEIPRDRFWIRAMRRGDIVKVDPPAASAIHEGTPA